MLTLVTLLDEVTSVNMAGAGDADVEALRARLHARTDMELAERIGVQRSTIAQWRRRGGLPAKYRALIRQPSDEEMSAVFYQVTAEHVLGDARHRFWLRAALALLPSEYLVAEKGCRIDPSIQERALLRLMYAALMATLTGLGKVTCESEEDYAILINLLEEDRLGICAELLQALPPRAN
jgi:hypothetical protein